MIIYLFSDYTGMFDFEKFYPSVKNSLTVGNITGTISFNSHNYPITNGQALIPIEAFTGEKVEVIVTAKVNNLTKHWNVEPLTLKNGTYVTPEFTSRELMLRVRNENESLRAEIKSIKEEISSIKQKLKTPFTKGGTK